MEVLPDYIKNKWQEITNLLAELIEIPSSLIMFNENKYMEVFISSKTKGNPYQVGDKEKWDGLYCETVIKSQMELLIPNALNDRNWNKNPDIKHGMISYLGFPINYPDKKPFGTICVLDKKENEFSETHIKLIQQFRDIIENDLANMFKYASIEVEIKKLSEAVKQSANSIVITDLKGNIEYTNPKFSKITGYTAEEVLGKNPNILNSRQQSKEFYSNMWEILSRGEIWRGEFKNKKKNGKFYWEEATISPIKNDTGEIINFLAIKRDISELKENEKILNEKNIELSQLSDKLTEKNRQLFDSENKYKKLFNKSPVSIMEQDFSEVIKLLNKKKAETSNIETYLNENLSFVKKCVSKIEVKNVNEITLSLLGIKNLEELKSHFTKTNTEKSFLSLKNELVSIALGKKDFYGETEFIKSDGTILHAMIKSTMIDDNGGNIASIVDITEITKTQEELILAKEIAEVNNANISAIIEGTNNSIWAFDQNYNILYINQTFQREFKNSFGILLDQGVNLIDALPQELKLLWKSRYDKVLNNEQFTFEDAVDTENGMIYIEVTFNPIIKNSQVVGGSCMGSNITERKLAELELIVAKEKAEESDKLKTEFINNMSHEIRTPMNGILGFSEMLGNPDISDKKRDNFVKIIQSSGNQLLKIIDDILEISILGTKQVKVIEEEVCLNNNLLELFSIFEIKAKINKTPLYLKKELSDKKSTILVDKLKLNKVLNNLLENALKFTNEGFVEFGYLLKNNELELYVKDTGIGIEKAKHKSIFERFSQAEKDLSKKVGGLGLGLSIAKENAELLGGTIRLESKKGEGSNFFVTIPYNPVYKDNNIANESPDTQYEYTILITEDEEVNYLYLETLLKDVIRLNCKIIHAINGQKAIEVCENNKVIDLVLMDLKMPLMTGYEATKQIKEFCPSLPIIAQTAYSTGKEKEQANIAGCDDFISKPISKEAIRLILDKYLVKNLKSLK